MTDLTQRPLPALDLGPRAEPAAEAPDPDVLRQAAAPALEAEPPAPEVERPAPEAESTAANDAPAKVADAPESTIARGGAALDDIIRDAASLRDAVARFEFTSAPSGAGSPDEALLRDSLAAAQEREQRVRDDTVALTRGLARITTQSALLLAKFTEAMSPMLPHDAERRRRAPWIALGVGLAGVAAVVSALALFQARENARQMERLQQALAKAIDDSAAAQALAARTLDARMREIASREAALLPAVKSAPPPPAPPPSIAKPAPRAETKSTAPAQGTKRKAAR